MITLGDYRSPKRHNARVLHEAALRDADQTIERTRNLTTKASFLAVSAGVLITATVTPAWSVSPWWLVASLTLAVFALILAADGMKPLNLQAAAIGEFAKDHETVRISEAKLRIRLIRIEASLTQEREAFNRRIAKPIKFGYFLLSASGATLILSFVLDIFARGGAISG